MFGGSFTLQLKVHGRHRVLLFVVVVLCCLFLFCSVFHFKLKMYYWLNACSYTRLRYLKCIFVGQIMRYLHLSHRRAMEPRVSLCKCADL